MTGILCAIAGATYAAAGRTAKTVTAIGDAKISTAQSKFGGASATFDGNGDLLQADTSAALTIASSTDFTIEGWIRPGSVSGTTALLTDRASSSSLSGVNWDISIFNGTYLTSRTATLLFETGSGAGNIIIISNNNVFATNTWYHFAVVRSSNVISLYVNGVDVTNNRVGTQSSAIGAGNLTMGGFPNNSLMYSGHMDEIRWSNTARYTAGFTAPTAAFTNDANTLLLLHCNGSNNTTVFTDDVGTNFIPRTPKTITANGNAKVSTAQNKFGGASALFDGTNDGLSVDNSDFAFGTGDFTYECFVRVADTNAFMLFDGTNPTGSTNAVSVWAQLGSLYVYSGGWTLNGVGTINNNTWYHVAVSRSASNLKAFIDGTQVGTTQSFSTNFTQSILHMGKARIDAGYDGNGYMDEIRISNSARYTANFTAPTAPFTNDRDTLLLLHCDGTNNSTTFTDDNGVRSPKGISAIGDAKVSTAQSKFGGASTIMDGNDYLQLLGASAADLGIGSGDFTIEGWIYITNWTSGVIIDSRGSPQNGSGWCWYLSSSNTLRWYFSFVDRITSSSLSTNTWYHIAMVRSGNDHKMYINGTQTGSTYTAANTYIIGSSSLGVWIGDNQPFPGNGLKGHIDEIRVSNTARYTANFTAPTAAFTNDNNTLLLIHANGTNNSTAFTDDNA